MWAGLLISLRVLNLGVLLLAENSLLDEMDNIIVQQCSVMSVQTGDCAYDLHSVLQLPLWIRPCMHVMSV